MKSSQTNSEYSNQPKSVSYLKPTDLYLEADRRLNELYLVRKGLEKRIRMYPAGDIHIVKSEKRIQYYLRTDKKDKTGTYISNRDKKKIAVLLQKKYDLKTLKQINAEIKNIETFLKKRNMNKQLQDIYSACPQQVKNIIMPIDISDDDFLNDWISRPYEAKGIDENMPVFLTDKGDRVRSKSELNIANILYKMNIPYKYECPLRLSMGLIIHPDFTLLDIKKRREVYWEHRGMMDDRGYLRHTVQRLKDYRKEGIIFGDNLIITEETGTIPLGTDEIMNVIRKFLS
ncbi:MAG: hypothetical protein Q4B67_03130 [Eubacteriales bacterium]|nr:hypothetical protein [Eubacteriales bacterium]